MNIKCLRCPGNDSLEIVMKQIAPTKIQLELNKVYGDKLDDDGETYNELANAIKKAEKLPETFEEAVMLMLNDIGLAIENLQYELWRTKNDLYIERTKDNDLPF